MNDEADATAPGRANAPAGGGGHEPRGSHAEAPDTHARRAVEAASPLLERAIADGVTPGAVLLVGSLQGDRHGDRQGDRHGVALGERRYGGAPVTMDTRYDLASLTKVVGCLPALLHLLDAGEIHLDDPVRRFFSNAGWFQQPSLGDATIEQLALHASGLPAWRPLFAWVNDRRTAIANVLQTELSEGAGVHRYSDLGVIVLTAVIERVSGVHLDVFLHRHVFAPMGMSTTRFGPLPHDLPVAATEDDGWRGRMLEGEVHDENAFVLDGVSGHAGLFATAADLLRYGRAWATLDAPFASADWMAAALRDRSGGVGSPRGLLWGLRHDDWAFGSGARPGAFGHTGFTGTSLVVDPAAGWVSVLLSNRVHPQRGSADGIIALRGAVHDAIASTFQEAAG